MALDLKKIDVIDFLERLDIDNITEHDDEVIFSCPFSGHKNADMNPSASMNKEHTAFHCFGCKRSGNAITFLAELLGVPTVLASRYIAEKYGDGIGEDFLLQEHFNLIFNKKNNTVQYEKEEILDENECKFRKQELRKNPQALEYILGRGFLPKTLEEFDIGYDTLSDRLTIPIRNSSGLLIGFKARIIQPNQESNVPKYLVLGDRGNKSKKYGFSTFNVGKYLFNLHTLPKRVDNLVLVEGELNLMQLKQTFPHMNVVALLGSQFTPTQRDLVLKYARSVLIFTDNDAAGEKCKNAIIKELYNLIPIKSVEYPSIDFDSDINQMSEEQCLSLILESKTPIENYLTAKEEKWQKESKTY